MKNESDIFDVDLYDFEEKVITASHQRPVLLDLWADWCSPCIVIAPILKKVITEFEGQVALAKIEVDEDENMKIAGKYRVRGFPTIILFQNGEEKARFSGAHPASFIEKFIEENAEL
ncbi:MAG: thioredoxin family protein [Gammaproteobacteria bacterium]|nr:thioredoxin family protein [Gammaproteobacteria bacterium]